MSTPTFDAQEAALAQASGDANFIAMANAGINTPVAAVASKVSGSGDGSGDGESDWDIQRRYYEQKDQANTLGAVKNAFSQYGLASLYPKIEQYVKAGYNADTIAILLRETPEYKTRFPAMTALAAKGRAINEGDYIAYERGAAALEQRYGLPKNMLMDNVTTLLTNDVSTAELNDRVILASAASLEAPQALKDQFKEYYGIDQGGLAAYFLDPEVAAPLLQKQFAASQIGAEAVAQGIGIDVMGAENLQQLGITQDTARTGFSKVAGQAGLMTGAGDTATQKDLIAGNLLGDATAKKNIERAAGSRVGRFQGGGNFINDKTGNVGLGSAATQ